jgi:cytochrome c oxidase subunit 2
MNSPFALWPPEASAHAAGVDHLFLAFSALVIALTAPVFILQVIYVILYRRGRPADRSPRTDGNVLLEVSWSVIPFLLTLGFFVWSGWLFFEIGRPPADALRIDVEARQWMWKFEHPGGQREIDELHVPANEPVKLVMTSNDVIHSLFLPALRLKQDVLPGRYTSVWFQATRPGVYALRCSQFCGFDHSAMVGRFVVQTPDDYARWLEQAGTDGSLAQQGFQLFRSLGCSGCHGPDSTHRAPKLEGIYGHPVALDGGRTTIADDQYIRDSILYPAKDVAAGYAPIMPTFAGQVTEADLVRLEAYIKSLGDAQSLNGEASQ